jgi:hypothetical protein
MQCADIGRLHREDRIDDRARTFEIAPRGSEAGACDLYLRIVRRQDQEPPEKRIALVERGPPQPDQDEAVESSRVIRLHLESGAVELFRQTMVSARPRRVRPLRNRLLAGNRRCNQAGQ